MPEAKQPANTAESDTYDFPSNKLPEICVEFAPTMPSLAALYLAGVISGAAFFGAYIILTFTAVYLLARREKTATSIFMMVLTLVMFGVSTAYFVLDIILVSNGVLHPQEYPETVIDLWGPQHRLSSVLGDSIVIWRAWVVWGRQLSVVIAPLVLLFGVAFSSFGAAVAQSRALADPSYLTVFNIFMIALPSLTLATNVTATALILWRILRASIRTVEHHGAVTHGTVQLHRLLKILIESGGLYCLTWLLLLCFNLTGYPASHVFLSIIGQLTGIYPTLIIVLVSINLTQDRIQGPVYESAIRFDRNPQASLAHTVSVTLAYGPHNGCERDAEAGDVLKSGDGADYAIDGTPSDCPSSSALKVGSDEA
ncbi:hypothetical protein EDB84DRAFT_1556872 [Lactarius hengduanensis]|nr:hypothetical protein EDB84DRAFT_1556872 [Lactarius hengduanensis]